jgi:hypothetical protein
MEQLQYCGIHQLCDADFPMEFANSKQSANGPSVNGTASILWNSSAL